MQSKRHPAYKRIFLALDPDIKKVVTEDLVGKLGKNPPDVIKNILRIYLAERGYFRGQLFEVHQPGGKI